MAQRGTMLSQTLRSSWIFDFVLRSSEFFSSAKPFFLFGFYNFPPKQVWGFNPFKYTSYKHHQLLQHQYQHQHPQHQQEMHSLTS